MKLEVGHHRTSPDNTLHILHDAERTAETTQQNYTTAS